jgi:hypothetical protein
MGRVQFRKPHAKTPGAQPIIDRIELPAHFGVADRPTEASA